MRDRTALVEHPRRRRAYRHVTAVARPSHLYPGRESDVLDRRHSHVGVSFEAERQDRDDDEQDGECRDDLK